MLNLALSPKVLLPVIVQLVAAALLWLVTGDNASLVLLLTGLSTLGLGAIAPPAPGVTQADVRALARKSPSRRT